MARSMQLPWAVGALQALLPCGALAGALVLAAGRAETLEGGMLMVSFAVCSSLGLLGAASLGRAVARLRNAHVGRTLAVVCAVAAVTLFVRPLEALRAPEPMPADCPLHAPTTTGQRTQPTPGSTVPANHHDAWTTETAPRGS